MKTLAILIFTIVCLSQVNAQTNQKYIDEAVALVKIRSFVPSDNSKKCDLYTYIRKGNHASKAKYLVELKHGSMGDVVFREQIDFNNLQGSGLLKSYRQKDDVYELFFGLWKIKENTMVNLIIIDENGDQITLPMEYSNYKNPITIMN